MTFDRLAPFYPAMESIAAGGKLQRCRLAFLDEIPAPRRVLLAGEGHGRFLTECTRRFPEAEIVVVDASARMLEIAMRKPGASRVEFIHSDLLEWQPQEGDFDLIVTHFFLDCFPADSLATIVARLAGLAAGDAHWLLADFQIAPTRMAGLRCRVIVALLYRFFRITCGLHADALVSPDADLIKSGFLRHRRITTELDLLKSEWWRRTSES